MKLNVHNTAIIVGLLTLIGTIATGLFQHWDRIFADEGGGNGNQTSSASAKFQIEVLGLNLEENGDRRLSGATDAEIEYMVRCDAASAKSVSITTASFRLSDYQKGYISVPIVGFECSQPEFPLTVEASVFDRDNNRRSGLLGKFNLIYLEPTPKTLESHGFERDVDGIEIRMSPR